MSLIDDLKVVDLEINTNIVKKYISIIKLKMIDINITDNIPSSTKLLNRNIAIELTHITRIIKVSIASLFIVNFIISHPFT